MKFIKQSFLFCLLLVFTNCASFYDLIDPISINYVSVKEADSVEFAYKYNVLDKKYEKQESKKATKLIAVRVTNKSGQDLVFGKDIKLVYENDQEIYIMDNKMVFNTLKQPTIPYLWYLLLSFLTFNTTESTNNGTETSSTPVGLVIGPGLAGGNMGVAYSSNEKFNRELIQFKIYGSTIMNGETKYGLIGIQTDSYAPLKLKVN